MNNTKHRIISIDAGNKISGIVVADVSVDTLDIILLNVVNDNIIEYLKNTVLPQIKDTDNPMLIYENAIFYRNWDLIRINKRLRKVCETHCKNFSVIALLPSQKVGLKTGNRKEASIESAIRFISEHQSSYLEQFKSFERKHDVADALAMLRYVKENKLGKSLKRNIQGGKGKEKKKQKNTSEHEV